VKRHRRPLSAAAVIFVAIVALVAFYTSRLTTARNDALAEAARTHRIQSYMLSLFGGGDEEAGPPDSLRVLTLVDRGLQEARSLDKEPLVQAELYHTLGGIYQQLGQTDRADSLLSAALERRRALLGDEHPEVAESLVALALLRVDQARYEDAERTAEEALALSRRVLPASDPLVDQAMVALGRVLEERGEYDRALEILEDVARRHVESGAPDLEVAASLHELANTHFYAGDYAVSDSLNRRVLELSRRIHGDRHPDVADDLVNLGATQVQLGRYEDAERFFREALAITQSWYGDDHLKVATNLTMLGRSLVMQGQFDEAEPELRRALGILERVRGPMHPRVASIRNELGSIALQTGDLDGAEAEFRRTLEIYRAVYGDEHDFVALALSNLASAHMKRGDYVRAEAEFRDVVARYGRALSADHLNTGIARIKLGRALLRQGKAAEAEKESRAGHDIVARQSDPSVSFLKAARADLVEAYTLLNRPEDAERFRADPPEATSQ
jgi:serine/threonine-protein kinase